MSDEGGGDHALVLQISADNSKMLRAFETAVSKIDKFADTIEKRAKKTAEATEKGFFGDGLGKALDKTFDATRFKVLDSGVAKVGLFGGALESLGPAGMAAAAGIGAAFAAFAGAREAAKFADDIGDTANRLHVTTDALQEYRYAVRLAGGEEKGADTALEAFNVTLGKAQAGLPKALKAFKELGFTKEQVKGFADADSALKAVTERIAGLSDVQKDAVIDQLGLTGLKPLIEAGADEMARLRDEAHKVGIVMDAELVKRGGELNDQFETVHQVIDVQLKSALVDLGPVLVDLLGFIAQLAKKAAEVADSFRSIQNRRTELLQQQRTQALMAANAPFATPGVRQARLEQVAQIDAELKRRADEAKTPPKPPKPPTRELIDQSKTGGSTPRDTTDQRTQQVIGELEAAERAVLQGMLTLATSTQARVNLQKQIVDRETAVQAAKIAKEEADIRADKGLSAAKQRELIAQLDVVQAKNVEAARLKKQQIDAAAADAIAKEQLDQANAVRDGEAELLDLQGQLTFSEATRAQIALQLVELAYQRQRAELEGVIAAKTSSDADKQLARIKLQQLDAAQPGRQESARRNGSEPARQVGQIVGGIKAQGGQLAQTRAMYEEIDRLRQADVISEREAAQARAEVNARQNEARLESSRSFFGNLASLSGSSNKTLAAIGKASAIATATIDGVLAVQKALAAYPPPVNFAMAASVGVAAAVNVAKIAGLKDGGEVVGPGGPRDDKVLRWLSNGEHVVNAGAASQPGVRAMLDHLNSGRDLRALLPQPMLPALAAPSPSSSSGGDVHLHPTWHITNPNPDLERLIERQPRVLKRAIENMVRNRELAIGGRS